MYFLQECAKVKVAMLGYPPLIVRTVSVDVTVKQHWTLFSTSHLCLDFKVQGQFGERWSILMLHFIPWCFTFTCLFCKTDIINEGKWFPFKYFFFKEHSPPAVCSLTLIKISGHPRLAFKRKYTLHAHKQACCICLAYNPQEHTGLAPYLVCEKHHTGTHTHTNPHPCTQSWLVWPALHKDTHHAHSHGWFDLLCTKTLTMHTKSRLVWLASHKDTMHRHGWFDLLCTKTFTIHAGSLALGFAQKNIFGYETKSCLSCPHLHKYSSHADSASTPAHSTDLASVIWPTHSTDLASFARHTLTVTQHKCIWPIASCLHTAQTDLANCIWLAYSPNRSGQLYLACTLHRSSQLQLACAQHRVAQLYLACTQHRFGQHHPACTQHKTDLAKCIWLAYSTHLANFIRLAHCTNRFDQLHMASTQHIQIWPFVFGLHAAQIWPILSGLHTAQCALHGLHTAETDSGSFTWLVHSTGRTDQLHRACTETRHTGRFG